MPLAWQLSQEAASNTASVSAVKHKVLCKFTGSLLMVDRVDGPATFGQQGGEVDSLQPYVADSPRVAKKQLPKSSSHGPPPLGLLRSTQFHGDRMVLNETLKRFFDGLAVRKNATQ